MTYKDTPDAWQTRLQLHLRLPFPIPWIGVACLMFLSGIAVLVFVEESLTQWRLLAIEATMIAALANAAVYLETLLDNVADNFPKLLDEETEVTQEWISKWYNDIFWSNRNLIAGSAGGIAVLVLGLTVVSDLFTSWIGIVYAYILDIAIGFLAGSLGWMMLGLARLTSSLGRDVHIRPSIFDTSTSPLRAASSVLWKVTLVGTFLYVLGVSIYPLCSIEPNTINMAGILSAAFAVLLYFIVPQVNIHRSLKKLKQDRLDLLVTQIDATFDRVAADPFSFLNHRLRHW